MKPQMDKSNDTGRKSACAGPEICKAIWHWSHSAGFPAGSDEWVAGRFVFILAREGRLYRVQTTWEETDDLTATQIGDGA